MTSILFASPLYDGRVDIEFLLSLRMTEEVVPTLGDYCFQTCFPVGLSHTLARDRIAADALESESDILFSVDSDQSWGPMTFEVMVRACLKTQGIVGAVVPFRHPDCIKHAVRFDRERKVNGFILGGRRFLEPMWVGTGMFCVHSEALLKMSATAKTWAYVRDGETLANLFWMGSYDGVFRTEDMNFCSLARESMVSVHALVDAPDVAHRIAPGLYAKQNNAAFLEGLELNLTPEEKKR
jgi:hypothetical protein